MSMRLFINLIMIASLLATPGIGQSPHQAPGAPDTSGKTTTTSSRKIERYYTMKASVRPLLFWISRNGVGGGRIAWIEEEDGAKGLELLIGSDPARAPRAINRWGYISERVSGPSAELIGVMTQSDEQSIDQADAATNKPPNTYTYKTIHCRLKGGEAQSMVTLLYLTEVFTYKNYEALLGRIPKTGAKVRQLQVPKGVDSGFLFSIKAMLHNTVESYKQLKGSRSECSAQRQYVYNASLFSLSMVSSKFKGTIVANGRTYPGIIESRFEARNTRTGKTSRFIIGYGTEGSISEVPVRIVYQPRWWLQAELLLKDDALNMQAAGKTGEK
jgi:hypothetical protein